MEPAEKDIVIEKVKEMPPEQVAKDVYKRQPLWMISIAVLYVWALFFYMIFRESRLCFQVMLH